MSADDFQDEPMIPEGTKVEFEGLKQATTKAERRRERRKRRNERTGKIAAVILLILIIIAVIVSVSLEKKVEHVLYADSNLADSDAPSVTPTDRLPTVMVTTSPTVAPKPTFSIKTPSPTTHRTLSPNFVPTVSPTNSAAPTMTMRSSYQFQPMADTYVYLDGPAKVQKFGGAETMWVQQGNADATLPGQEPTIPTILGMMQFDTKANTFHDNTGLPQDRSRWHENKIKVTLQIHHKPKSEGEDNMDVEDLAPVEMEIYRMPNYPEYDYKGMTGVDFNFAPKEAKDGILITTISVEPEATILEIDVTNAIFLDRIKDPKPASYDPERYKDNMVLFLFKIYWEEDAQIGDEFYTKESDTERTPLLIYKNMLKK